MGVRITGISTPVGGITWEYTKAEERTIPLLVSPGQKNVLISSICGAEKYDKVRIELNYSILGDYRYGYVTNQGRSYYPSKCSAMASVCVYRHKMECYTYSSYIVPQFGE